jgi:hypothetical protein
LFTPVAELKIEAFEADGRADIELDLIRAVAGVDINAEVGSGGVRIRSARFRSLCGVL